MIKLYNFPMNLDSKYRYKYLYLHLLSKLIGKYLSQELFSTKPD